jgi:hypothetical protein
LPATRCVGGRRERERERERKRERKRKRKRCFGAAARSVLRCVGEGAGNRTEDGGDEL